MGLQHFERRLERLVEGVFARAFRSGLQPVEVGRRITREMDLQRTLGVRGVIAPNAFTVVLSPPDTERFASFADSFERELVEAVHEHARTQGYVLMGQAEVSLESDPRLRSGTFLVQGRVQEATTGKPVGAVVRSDGTRVEVGDRPLTIGRLPESDVVLADPNVSRRHAQVARRGKTFVVVDLGSTNGTRVNGAVVGEKRLADGDEITLGTTTLRFEAS